MEIHSFPNDLGCHSKFERQSRNGKISHRFLSCSAPLVRAAEAEVGTQIPCAVSFSSLSSQLSFPPSSPQRGPAEAAGCDNPQTSGMVGRSTFHNRMVKHKLPVVAAA